MDLLDQVPAKRSINYFHALRIEIKKIKALFRLIDFSSRKFQWKKAIKPYRLIFDIAGKIRETQVESQLIKEYVSSTNSKYKPILDQRLADFQIKFEILVKTNIQKRIATKYRLAEKAIESIQKDELSTYLKRAKRRIIRNLKRDPLIEADAHELRKQLKAYYYNLISLKKTKHLEVISTKKMEALQELLGKWHDQQVAFGHLNDFATRKGHSREYVSKLNVVMETIATRKLELLNKINKRISGFAL
jgi:CHAD domain-containing protein